MSDVTLRVRVTGRVQGVWYRGWTQKTARGLGLRGWVRNEADGAVSALIAGPEKAVEDMLRAMRRGPDLARVDGVETAPSDEDPGAGFRVLR